jgi:hypothetical protein
MMIMYPAESVAIGGVGTTLWVWIFWCR